MEVVGADGARLLFALLRNESFLRTRAHIQLTGAHDAVHALFCDAEVTGLMQQALMRQAFAHCAQVHAELQAKDEGEEAAVVTGDGGHTRHSDGASADHSPSALTPYEFVPDVDELRWWQSVADSGFRRALLLHPAMRRACAPVERLGSNAASASGPLWGLLLGRLFSRASPAEAASDAPCAGQEEEEEGRGVIGGGSSSGLSASLVHERLVRATCEAHHDPREAALHWFIDFLCAWLLPRRGSPGPLAAAPDSQPGAAVPHQVVYPARRLARSVTPEMVAQAAALVRFVTRGELPAPQSGALAAGATAMRPAVDASAMLAGAERRSLADFFNSRALTAAVMRANAHLLQRALIHGGVLLSRGGERLLAAALRPAMTLGEVLDCIDRVVFHDRLWMALLIGELLAGRSFAATDKNVPESRVAHERDDNGPESPEGLAKTVVEMCGVAHRVAPHQLKAISRELDAMSPRPDALVAMLCGAVKMKRPARQRGEDDGDSAGSSARSAVTSRCVYRLQLQPLNALYIAPPSAPQRRPFASPPPRRGFQQQQQQHQQQQQQRQPQQQRPLSARIARRVDHAAASAAAAARCGATVEEVSLLRRAADVAAAIGTSEAAERLADGGNAVRRFSGANDPLGLASALASTLDDSSAFHRLAAAAVPRMMAERGSVHDLRPTAVTPRAPYAPSLSQEKQDFRVRQRAIRERYADRCHARPAPLAQARLDIDIPGMVAMHFARRCAAMGGESDKPSPPRRPGTAAPTMGAADAQPESAVQRQPRPPRRELPQRLQPFDGTELVRRLFAS